VRPAGCQGYLSLDHLSCDASSFGAATPIVTPVASGLIRDAVISAQIIVLQEAGYDQTRIEISAGLAWAWADPAAERRWLAGGKAFSLAAAPAPRETESRPADSFAEAGGGTEWRGAAAD
jgi:hypothetical protein